MGQRTFILLKKNYMNNNGEWASRVSLIHHQWGIGRVMQGLLLQEVLKTQFPLDRSLQSIYSCDINSTTNDNGYLTQPISMFYTFSPLNNPISNYHIYDNSSVKAKDLGLIPTNRKEINYYLEDSKTLKTSIVDENSATVIFDYPCQYKYDVFDIKNIQAYYELTDNNNGCMVVEITQQYTSNGKVESILSEAFKVKVGFCTGSEEEDFYHASIGASTIRVCYNPAMSTLVSPTFYSTHTYRDSKGMKDFSKSFIAICKQADVQFTYDKTKEKKLLELEKSLNEICTSLAKKGLNASEIAEECNKVVKGRKLYYK